jgi:hypothetical protein
VWGWVSVCGSHSPPLDADRDWQTGEHLSPWRGIWCAIQLNTMSAHGIPWRCPSVGTSRQPVRERPRNSWERSPGQVSGTLLPPVTGYKIGRKDSKPGRSHRRPGLTVHAVPVPLAIEPPVSKSQARCLPQHQIFPELTSTWRFLQVSAGVAATRAAARPRRAAPGPSRSRSGPRPPATAWLLRRLRPAARAGRRTAAPGSSPGSRATPGSGPRDTG